VCRDFSTQRARDFFATEFISVVTTPLHHISRDFSGQL
jgi:hypothetical protein